MLALGHDGRLASVRASLQRPSERPPARGQCQIVVTGSGAPACRRVRTIRHDVKIDVLGVAQHVVDDGALQKDLEPISGRLAEDEMVDVVLPRKLHQRVADGEAAAGSGQLVDFDAEVVGEQEVVAEPLLLHQIERLPIDDGDRHDAVRPEPVPEPPGGP